MCPTNKVPYPNRKEARAGMNRFNRHPDNKKKAKAIYRCPYCKKHHFTTQNRAEAKEDRKYHLIQAQLMRDLHQIY